MDLTESSSSSNNLDKASNSPVITSRTMARFSNNDLATTTNAAINVDLLQLINMTESRNFTCQAQNSFGLVLFNLTLIIKGIFYFFDFLIWMIDYLLFYSIIIIIINPCLVPLIHCFCELLVWYWLIEPEFEFSFFFSFM